jgi:hypothetical protein
VKLAASFHFPLMKTFSLSCVFACVAAAAFSAEPKQTKTVQLAYAGPFVCSAEAPVHLENFPVPPGDYQRLVFDMDIVTGPWSPVNPRGWHDLFWMVRKNRNLFMFGYAAMRKDGDKSPEVMLRQGLGVQHPKKSKDIQEIAIEPHTAYHIHYDFDVGAGRAVMTITHGDKELKRIETVPLLEPAAKSFNFAEGDTLTVGLSTAIGLDKPTGPETPSLGWTYRNLHASLEPVADAR